MMLRTRHGFLALYTTSSAIFTCSNRTHLFSTEVNGKDVHVTCMQNWIIPINCITNWTYYLYTGESDWAGLSLQKKKKGRLYNLY